MVYRLLILVLVVNVFATPVMSARILAVLPSPSISHNIVYHPILRELSLRGHQVVSIIPDCINDPTLLNLTEIDVHFSYEIWNSLSNFTQERQEDYSPMQGMYCSSQKLAKVCDAELAAPEVKKLIQNKKEHFDLVITEWLVYPSTYAFAERFNCPIVGVSSLGLNLHGHDAIGNPMHPAYSPDFFLPYSHSLTFTERVYSTIYAVWYRWYFHFTLLPQHYAIAQKHFGKDLPYLTEVMKRISVVFISENPAFAGYKPIVPAAIDISGLHFKPEKPLPQDLQIMLDKAKQGFIYFSLGTNVKSKNLPPKSLQALLDAFAELPYQILWKFEKDILEGKPKNVEIRKWFPQQDILAHPNIKLFFMQGGLQSSEEAIKYKVPMIAVPFFADQEQNAARYKRHGIGERLGFDALTKDNILTVINKIIDDKRYKERISNLSGLMWDTPISSLDRAIWWIEYVLRHKGAKHLRSPTADMPWHQYLLLDVIAFLIGCALLAVLIPYYTIKFIVRLVTRPAKSKSKKLKKK